MKKGFGLLETVLAAGILTLVLAGVVSLGRISLRAATVNQTRTQAFQIAQEGLEGVRAIRDTNVLDADRATEWKESLDLNSSGHGVDYDTTLKKWVIKLNSPTFHNNFFTRKVDFDNTIVDEIKATVTVSWLESGQKSVILETILTNWRQEE